MLMSEEVLLEKARRDYPKGTIYTPINGNTLTPVNFQEYSGTSSGIISHYNNPFMIYCGYGYIYYNGVWAKRLITEPQIVENYLIY